MKTVLVVGSAHLDVLARARNRDDVADRVGEFHIEVGGTAANIAINLAQSGVNARLLTAMNDSPFSRTIAEYLGDMGVETHIRFVPGLGTAGFSAHLDTQGEMIGAVSDTPVDQVNFDEAEIDAAMRWAVAVVLDCNLSPLAMNRLVTMANDRNVPAYLAAVSEEKCVRIAGITGRIKGIFINQREFQFFCRQVLGQPRAPAEVARAIPAALLVTDGAAGSTLALPDGSSAHVAPAAVGASGSRLGMGDAMAAGVILLHEVKQMTLLDAAHGALKMVAQVGAGHHCHHGEDGALERAIGRFQYRAGHDAMTGAMNRYSTEQALNHALERRAANQSEAVSVLIIDIDHFKSINDTYGHNAGDRVIIDVAATVKGCLRDGDLLGRWGGEEFIVVLAGTDESDAMVVAERIRSSVEESVKQPRRVTVSIGCSEAGKDGVTDLHVLVENADKALYDAKHSGRNCVRLFSQSLLSEA